MLSLHASGLGPVHLHASVDKNPLLKPVINTGFTKDFYFFPEEKYFYCYNDSALHTDIPGFIKGIFFATNKQNRIIQIYLFIADEQDLLKQYLVSKFGDLYSVTEAGAAQIGTRSHYIWTTSIGSQVYFLPKKYDALALSKTLSVIEICYFDDFDLLIDYCVYRAF